MSFKCSSCRGTGVKPRSVTGESCSYCNGMGATGPKVQKPTLPFLYEVCGLYVCIHVVLRQEDDKIYLRRKGDLYTSSVAKSWVDSTYQSWWTSLERALKELERRNRERKKRLEQDLMDTNTVLDMLEDNSEVNLVKNGIIK